MSIRGIPPEVGRRTRASAPAAARAGRPALPADRCARCATLPTTAHCIHTTLIAAQITRTLPVLDVLILCQG